MDGIPQIPFYALESKRLRVVAATKLPAPKAWAATNKYGPVQSSELK